MSLLHPFAPHGQTTNDLTNPSMEKGEEEEEEKEEQEGVLLTSLSIPYHNHDDLLSLHSLYFNLHLSPGGGRWWRKGEGDKA
ncbi:hypothetical protein SK128_007542 [Halocaridina rubra]|uniref:Uncharacterized protein n=1 Tax=Halocaridina rubra TaxID=373956 RepID=A0AAN8WFL6_HALRR